MNCFNKIKALATKKGMSQKEISQHFDMSYNSFNNKLRDCETRFNLKDLIKYTNLLNMKVAIIDENNNIIETLDKTDLKENND